MPTKRTRKPVRAPYTFQKLKDDLWAMKGGNEPRTLRQIAAGFEVSHGVIQRALHGIEPKDPTIRGRLGLPVLVPTEVCPIHHIVHEKRCPGRNGKPAPRRHNWRREYERLKVKYERLHEKWLSR